METILIVMGILLMVGWTKQAAETEENFNVIFLTLVFITSPFILVIAIGGRVQRFFSYDN